MKSEEVQTPLLKMLLG